MGKRCSRGVTLVEMLMVLVVMGVLATTVIPGFAHLLHHTRQSTLGNQFLADLARARSEAIRRGARVVLCKSADGVACIASGDWGQGWLVFQDSNNNGIREVSEDRISRLEAQPIDWKIQGTFTGAHFISYHPTGRTMLPTGSWQGGTLTICRRNAAPTEALEIVISLSGRPRSQRTPVAQCT